MNKFRGSLIVTLILAWLFVCAIAIVVDPNVVAQTHEDLHSSALNLDHEKVAAGATDPTPTLIVGKVLDPEDRAVPRTVVRLTEADGTKHTTTSDSFGNFRFDEVMGGQQAVLSAEPGRYSFSDLPVGLAGETIVSWRAITK